MVVRLLMYGLKVVALRNTVGYHRDEKVEVVFEKWMNRISSASARQCILDFMKIKTAKLVWTETFHHFISKRKEDPKLV